MKNYETISDKVILHVNTVNVTEKDRFLGHHQILLNFNQVMYITDSRNKVRMRTDFTTQTFFLHLLNARVGFIFLKTLCCLRRGHRRESQKAFLLLLTV